MIIKGSQHVNPKTGDWLGLYAMKFKFLENRVKNQELVLIDTNKWQKMSEADQYAMLYSLQKKD